MESLLRGAVSDDDDSFSNEEFEDEDDNSKKIIADDDESHSGLLDSLGKSLGANLRKREEKKKNMRINEYQSIPNDDRGQLPSFRGVKTIRKDKKKQKKQGQADEEEQDEQEIYDEVYDDPNVTKPALEKSKRSALYEHTKRDVSKWNSIVYHNRGASQLVFPLPTGEKISKRSMKDSVQEFVPQTPLEEEIAKLLYGNDFVEKKKAELHSKDEKTPDESYKLSIAEALEQHNELARLRAIQSYEIAKAKRRNKIKSKKYHRLLRKEKIKKQLKEFEELKQNDPEAALQKLQELEVTRAKERMTLKHRNTSKWAKSQAFRAKYDKDARIALAEQLRISKELTQKVEESSDDDDDEVDDGMLEQGKDGDAYQVKGYNLNQAEINQESSPSTQKAATQEKLNLLAMRAFATPEAAPSIFLKKSTLDPKNYLVINPKFNSKEITVDKELLQEGEQEFENQDDEDQRMVIAEAFEDDDVVSEFQKSKADQIDASKPKDIDLTLPGWGSWGGKDVKPSMKKPKMFIKKAPPAPARKDEKLSHVIINESAVNNQKLRDHQVKQLPFPFKRVQDFEKIIRAPVGRTWMPERAMKDLIAPKVITRISSVIKPISEDVLVKKKDKKVKPGGHLKLVAGVVKKKGTTATTKKNKNGI